MMEHLLNPITYLGVVFLVFAALTVPLRKKMEWALSARQFIYGAVFCFLAGLLAAYSISQIDPALLQKSAGH